MLEIEQEGTLVEWRYRKRKPEEEKIFLKIAEKTTTGEDYNTE